MLTRHLFKGSYSIPTPSRFTILRGTIQLLSQNLQFLNFHRL